MRKTRLTSLPAPYLKRLWMRKDASLGEQYPFNLPWLDKDFVLDFATPVTIIVGENGTGKSTLIEALAALCGYDEAGGGKGYMPVDHSRAVDRSGAHLASALRASWLPKVTAGWFFRAESFFSVARFLDEAARDANAPPPDFLSWSHGEGFVRFFEERMSRQEYTYWTNRRVRFPRSANWNCFGFFMPFSDRPVRRSSWPHIRPS